MIDNNSVIHKDAIISETAEIGPYAVIGPNVEIRKNVKIHSHVNISGHTVVDDGTIIFPFASIGNAPQDLKYKGEKTKLEIGKNNKIREYVTINPGTENGGGLTKIGNNCLFMISSHIAHDCVVGNNVIIANNVPLGGHVIIEDNVVIGGNSAVQQFTRIGKLAMIGGMTGVLHDVIPYGLSIGNRNYLQGLNLIGLRRANFNNRDILGLNEAYKEIFTTKNLTDNINKLNGTFKENPLVKDVIEFIIKDKKDLFVHHFQKNKMIGLIFGETNFPIEILKKIKIRKLKHLIIDLSKSNKFKNEMNSHNVSIGQFGKIIKILKVNKCNKVLFAGKVDKPNFSKLKLDLKGIYYISRIIKKSKKGDAAILKEIINILKKEKIRTINSLTFNPELTLKKGIYSKVKPDKEDKKDIKKAISTLSKLGKYTFSQGTVVRNNKVVAIEGKGGTEKMLKKCRNKKFKNKGVLVKFPKKNKI